MIKFVEKGVHMDTLAIRQRLHNYLDIASDKKIKALFTIVENAVEEVEINYTPEMKKELEIRVKSYKKNPDTALTAKASKSRINQLLKSSK